MSLYRNKAYLKLVAKQPCCYCGQRPGGVAHHHRRNNGGGTALKPGDDQTVPLCDTHHKEFHNRFRIGFWTKEETEERFAKAMKQCQALGLEKGVLKPLRAADAERLAALELQEEVTPDEARELVGLRALRQRSYNVPEAQTTQGI